MKNLLHMNLAILLFLSIVLSNCKSKEQITPNIEDPISFSYLAYNLSIKDFTVKNSIIKTPTNVNDPKIENAITVLLPEDYQEDFIVPEITLNGYAKDISPKSGEKVVFEGKEAIEYTVTKKDGTVVKFKLYVVRQDNINVEILTKELTLDSLRYREIKYRFLKTGTIDSPTTSVPNNFYTYKIYNDAKKEVYNGADWANSKDTLSIKVENPYLIKSGNYSIIFTINESYQIGKPRKSNELNFNLKNGDKAYTYTLNYAPNKREFIKGFTFEMKGINFNPAKQYTIVFENDFKKQITLLSKFIDENTLTFTTSYNLDADMYYVTFKENERSIYGMLGSINNPETELVGLWEPSFFVTPPIPIKYMSNNSLILSQNQKYGGFLVWNPSDYKAYDLKLIDLQTKQEYLIKSEKIWEPVAFVSYSTFTIPESIPKGFYELYSVRENIVSQRYWRKLEVK